MSQSDDELRKAVAMLTILHATCQTTMNTLEAAGNPVDATLLEDLRRMTERTEDELLALDATFAN